MWVLLRGNDSFLFTWILLEALKENHLLYPEATWNSVALLVKSINRLKFLSCIQTFSFFLFTVIAPPLSSFSHPLRVSLVQRSPLVVLYWVFELYMTLTWNENNIKLNCFRNVRFQASKQEVRSPPLTSPWLILNLLSESFWLESHAKVICTSTSRITAQQEKITFCGGDEPKKPH